MDAYLVLGVSPDDTMEEIREKYIKLVKKYHPDNASAIENEEILKQINIAYCTIKQEKEKSEKAFEKRVHTDNYKYDMHNSGFSNESRPYAGNAEFRYGNTTRNIRETEYRRYIRGEYTDCGKKTDIRHYSKEKRKRKSNHVIFALALIALFFALRLLLLIFS